MAIHWKISFKSLDGIDYTANIYDDNYNGDAIDLMGAAKPFETDEDQDNNFFKAVRTQSGYIRIVDTGDNTLAWEQIIPTASKDRKVTLTNSNGDIYWRGYIQPQTFSGNLFENIQERDFPIMCPLSVLEGIDVDATITGVKNFAFLLSKIIESTGYDGFTIIFSGTSNMINEWMQKKIDWSNFLEEDNDGNITAKYNYFQLLEELCKFFGWICRTDGPTIFFLSPDESYYYAWSWITQTDLTNLANGISVQAHEVSNYDEVNLNDDIYMSTHQNIEMLRGARKVTLDADINKQDVIIGIPYNKIEDKYRSETPIDLQYGTQGHHFILNSSDYQGTPQTYNFPDMVIKTLGIPSNPDWTYPDLVYGSAFLVQEYYEGSLTYKHNYDWSTILKILGSFPIGSYFLCQIQSKSPHNYDHGVFVISGNVSQVITDGRQRQEYTANGYLICNLKIGDFWWNGSTWTDTDENNFSIPIGVEGTVTTTGSGAIITNRILNGPYNAYNGYGIPIGNAMGGIVTFEIRGVHLDNTHTENPPSVEISNLEMKFVREKTVAPYNDRSINKYIAENNSEFREEISLSTIFATNNGNALGLGIIMNSDGSYCNDLNYEYQNGITTQRPEQNVVNRISQYKRSVRKFANVEIASNAASAQVSPITKTLMSWRGYPIAIGRNWRDNITKVNILELDE